MACWKRAKWPVLVIIVSVMYSLLYKASPNVRQPAFRRASRPAAPSPLIIWLIAAGLFAVYVSFSSSYNKTYGSPGPLSFSWVGLWISNIAILALGPVQRRDPARTRLSVPGCPKNVEPFAELRDTRKLNDPEKRRVEEAVRRTRDRNMDQER